MIISILDYSTGQVEIISINNSESIEESLQDLGYNLNDIEYMVTDTLNLKINI